MKIPKLLRLQPNERAELLFHQTPIFQPRREDVTQLAPVSSSEDHPSQLLASQANILLCRKQVALAFPVSSIERR
jgi:hypothetical protein